MPHVDEGTLHALLDGALRAESPGRASEVEAHLAACGDCRARLEAAEELRGEASGILDAAIAGDLAAAPDFGEVVRRSESRPAPGPTGRLRRQARWTRGIAWAASLVLALGTGYLIRDLTGPTIDDVPSRSIRSEAIEDAPPVGSEGAAGEAADAGTDAETDAGTDDRMRAPRRQESSVDRTAAAPAERPTTESVEAELEGTEPVPAAPVPAPAPERMADAEAAMKQAEARDPEPLAVGARAAAREAERVVGEPVDIRPTALRQATTRWSPITVEEARQVLDGPFYVLPRAQLQNLYKRSDAGRQQVLSLQRLQTGVPIRVLQWRGEEEEPDGAADRTQLAASVEGAAPTADTALPFAALPDANVVRVVRDEYILELTGSLPAALLSVLGETADPAR